MGSSGMSAKLADFLKKNYPDTKSDMFACFIEKGFRMAKTTGFVSMITMESWMFLSSFEKMRQSIVMNKTIVNMVHMPYLGKGGTSLGINFGTAAVVFNNKKISNYAAQYDYVCYYETDDDGIPFEFPVINERYKTATTENFSKIPGSPIAYWVSENLLHDFSIGISLSKVAMPRTGIMTGDNNRFLRLWWELLDTKIYFAAKDFNDAIHSHAKWFPYNKGGEFRKWYGNNDFVVNWENGGEEVFGNAKAEKRNAQDYPPEYKFKPAISWSLVTSGQPAFRIKRSNLSDIAGPSLYTDSSHFNIILAFCNSLVALKILTMVNPTINFQGGNIAQLPIVFDEMDMTVVSATVEENADTSKADWDSFEISWDFKRHPLV